MPEVERMRSATNLEEPEESSTPRLSMKAISVVEFIAVLIALVLPITPSKTGKPFVWPASWEEYFSEVFLAFLMANAVFAVLFIVGWLFVKRREKSTKP